MARIVTREYLVEVYHDKGSSVVRAHRIPRNERWAESAERLSCETYAYWPVQATNSSAAIASLVYRGIEAAKERAR